MVIGTIARISLSPVGDVVKFRMLLWGLGIMMTRAARSDSEFKKKLEDKDVTFEIRSNDGVSRYFRIKNRRVRTYSGRTKKPEFALVFSSARKGFTTLTAKNTQLAFMEGIQSQDIVIEGNPAEVMWFQTLTPHLKPPSIPF